MSEMIQRAGRAARDSDMQGLFLELVEPWVLRLAINDAGSDDPDRPFSGTVAKNSSKQDRTGYAAIRFAQSETCRRVFLSKYLDDETPEGWVI